MTFAKIVKELRCENELTHQQLADEIGCSRAIIGHWESGRREPTAESIVRLAMFFDVSADYLLGLDQEYSPHRAKAHLRTNLSHESTEILDHFESLVPSNKIAAKAFIKGLYEGQKNKRENNLKD